MEKKPVFRELEVVVKDILLRRNYLCPEYDACLTLAAYSNVDLVCESCPRKEDRNPIFPFVELEINGCGALLNAIFGYRKN